MLVTSMTMLAELLLILYMSILPVEARSVSIELVAINDQNEHDFNIEQRTSPSNCGEEKYQPGPQWMLYRMYVRFPQRCGPEDEKKMVALRFTPNMGPRQPIMICIPLCGKGFTKSRKRRSILNHLQREDPEFGSPTPDIQASIPAGDEETSQRSINKIMPTDAKSPKNIE